MTPGTVATSGLSSLLRNCKSYMKLKFVMFFVLNIKRQSHGVMSGLASVPLASVTHCLVLSVLLTCLKDPLQ